MRTTVIRKIAVAFVAAIIPAGFARGLPAAEGTVVGAATTAAAEAPRHLARVSTTLITGDVVTLTGEGPRRSVDVQPAPGRHEVEMLVQETDGELFVFPADVLDMVHSQLLDRRLFNLDELQRQRLNDRDVDSLPLLVTRHRGSGPVALSDLPGVDPSSEPLESINGRGLSLTKDDAGRFWAALRPKGAEAANFSSGVAKIWLDARVEPDLEHSVPQIGAPAAWAAGVDGDGVRVAVLDTGVDADHPDLRGKVAAAANFSASPDEEDRFGHGTHVAATVAGTGAGPDSAPPRPGVAPAATILSGKVLDDSGSGLSSDVIAGMEWAVEQGADVVNMSLGSPAGDGLDPVSTSVNRLSAQSDTLFVASAGNSGPGEYTIGSPGAADAAIAVGAVDRNDRVADFSSRGPRLHDLAIKPDVTAPGVGIVAARAEGTSMGAVVDEHYTAASGTSMAAPHVAGAAALLAQRYPALDGEAIEDALLSTAVPAGDDVNVYGTGRVDVRRAMAAPIHASGAVDMGTQMADSSEPVESVLRLRNVTGRGLTVDLRLVEGTGPGGVAPAPTFSLSVPTVSVPAHGEASVEVRASAGHLPAGRHHVIVEASTGDAHPVRTLVSIAVTVPEHEVTLVPKGLDDGSPAPVAMVSLVGQDRRYDVLLDVSGPTTVRLAEGDYFLHSTSRGMVNGEEASFLVVDPDLEVTRPMTVALDQRSATAKVQIRTPQPAEPVGTWGFVTHRAVGDRNHSNHTNNFLNTTSLWVTPTAAARGGRFEVTSRWQLQAPMLTATVRGERGELWPGYPAFSPLFEGVRTFEAVDVGAGTADEFDEADVRGRIAYVSDPATPDETELAPLAAAAGAAFLVMAPGDRGAFTDWTPLGDRLPIPAVILNEAEAATLSRAFEERSLVQVRLEGRPGSPYLYDVMQISEGRVPKAIVHDVAATSARVTSSYTDNGSRWLQEQRYAWRPWQSYTVIETQRDVPTASPRVEWVTAGDTVWRQHVMPYPYQFLWSAIDTGMVGADRSYEPDERVRETWYGGVVRPAIPAGDRRMISRREGRELKLHVPSFADDSGEHHGMAEQGSFGVDTDTVVTEVFENGKLVSSGSDLWGAFPVREVAADYRVTLTTEREHEDWIHSPRTATEWEFRSTADGPVNLLQLDYRVPVDGHNTVRPAGALPVEVRVRPSPGAAARPLTSVRLWFATTDAPKWKSVKLVRTARGWYRAVLPVRSAGGRVSFRVAAADEAGNEVRQTVEEAVSLHHR